MTRRRNQQSDRRGAVAVEFAVVAPVLMAIAVGMIEVNRVYEAQNLLATAAREGARFASMDREGLLREGQTANDKLVDDIKTYLASNGIPRDSVQVGVKDHDDPTLDFDIDAPENDLRLFEVQVSADYSGVSYSPVAPGDDHSMSAKIVFRNGRATISQ